MPATFYILLLQVIVNYPNRCFFEISVENLPKLVSF
jgi:hypothetical protein